MSVQFVSRYIKLTLLVFACLCVIQKDEVLTAKAVPCGIFRGRKVLSVLLTTPTSESLSPHNILLCISY